MCCHLTFVTKVYDYNSHTAAPFIWEANRYEVQIIFGNWHRLLKGWFDNKKKKFNSKINAHIN